MVVTFVIVVVATASAAFAVIVVMVLVLMVMVVMVFMLVVIMMVMLVFVIVIMVVASACAILTVLVVVIVVVVIMVMVVMLVLLSFKESSCHVCSGDGALDSLEDLYSGEELPRCCDDLRMIVDALDELYCLIELLLADVACSGEDDSTCVLDLILVELCEVLKVDLALGCVDNRYGTADLSAFYLLNCSYYVGELTYT